jgi:hypothetical protein
VLDGGTPPRPQRWLDAASQVDTEEGDIQHLTVDIQLELLGSRVADSD